MIVGAMGCLHAKMVCEQIRDMFGDVLRIDWVGTGPHGRDSKENEAVIRKFCPPKRDGRRRPEDIQIDVLVHVGMAGEGMDSIYVTEVVHLNAATLSNQNDQENGRASRRIPNAPDNMQVAYINVDSSSAYAKWPGLKIMDCFDRTNGDPPPDDEDDEDDDSDDDDPTEWDVSDEPLVILVDCELARIDRGDPEVAALALAVAEAAFTTRGLGKQDIAEQLDVIRELLRSPNSEEASEWIAVGIAARRRQLLDNAAGQNGRSVLYQLRHDISGMTGAIASQVARERAPDRLSRKSMIGPLKKRLYGEMCRRFGCSIGQADEEDLRKRCTWVRQIAMGVRAGEMPSWLV
jgi:hypothetical protein